MSLILADLLSQVKKLYLDELTSNDGKEPYLTAERICHDVLMIETDTLARIITHDPSLLAARAGDLVMNKQECENPSVGVIVCASLIAVAMDELLRIAVEKGWLEADEEQQILIDEDELVQETEYPITVDYSVSEYARQKLGQAGATVLSKLFQVAEKSFLERLDNEIHDAYQLAMQVSSEYAVFAPEDLAPLVAENPLLLGLRPDGLIDDDLFEGDPPAGIIISSHLTHMLLEQLLELAAEQGALPKDSSGHLIMPEGEEDDPIVH